MNLTQSEAKEALARIAAHGTPEHAAYQVGVELRAIEPYTCSWLTRTRSILRIVAERPYTLAALELVAAGTPVQRYAGPDGVIRYRAQEAR